MQEQNRDQDIYDVIFSAPRRGFEGLMKGFMFAAAFCGTLDFAGIISFKPESKNFYLGLYFGSALIGYGFGLRNESRQPNIIILNEQALPALQRIGLFGQRALASRAPQTPSEGLVKGLMFSTTAMIFASNHLEISTILKIILAATVLCGMWGAGNQLRR